jgi:hypothetical protein
VILSSVEAEEFFSTMAAVDAYTNRRFGCLPGRDDPERMRDASPRDRVRVRDVRLTHPEILEEFVRENPFGLEERALADVRPLRHAVAGRFFIERVLKAHAVFVGVGEPTVVYAVGGITERIDDFVARAHPTGVPALVDTVLVPWRGRIVWDGVVAVLPIVIGPGVRRAFKDDYTKAKDRGAVVTTLGGSATPTKPPRPARDWRPAVSEIVSAVEALGKPETALQAATFTLLDRSARLAQVALDGDEDAVVDAARKVQRALRRVASILEP